MNTIWAEWKRIYSPSRRPRAADGGAFIDDARVRLQIDAESLSDVISAAADALSEPAGMSAAAVREALEDGLEEHVVLGGGISVPHSQMDGIERSIAALVTTARPVKVGEDEADLFFVLLAPKAAPRKHLEALAHVGRLCHDPALLDGLREASLPSQAVGLLQAAENGDFDTGSFASQSRLLAAIEVEDSQRVAQVSRMVDEAFGRSTAGSGRTEPIASVRRALGVPSWSHYVLVAIQDPDMPVLLALLEEESRVVGGAPCPVHLLRPENVALTPPTPPAAEAAERA